MEGGSPISSLVFIILLFLVFRFIYKFLRNISKRFDTNNESSKSNKIDENRTKVGNIYLTDAEYYEPTYEDLLQTREWQEKRKEILKKHNNTCDWCNTHSRLQIHHKYYLKYPDGVRLNPWEYPDDCFMCLCSKCHERYHRKYKVRTFIKNGRL